jgi:hypothetical protein
LKSLINLEKNKYFFEKFNNIDSSIETSNLKTFDKENGFYFLFFEKELYNVFFNSLINKYQKKKK